MTPDRVFNWNVVVLTCQHKDSVYAFQRELEIRQQGGLLPSGALLLTVPDPQEHVGSGGATLNALLVAAEHLSARAGYTVVTADVLYDAHVLILHTICPGSPPGVWVCSTDMILNISTMPNILWDNFSGVWAVSLPGDTSFAVNHGVYLTDAQGVVRDIIYRGSEERLRFAVLPDGKVPLVSGPVFFSTSVSERLLQTHVTPPLDGCTYLGLDSGALPLKISLFLDILMCLCSDVTEVEFVNGLRAGCSSPTGPQGEAVRSARSVLWRTLSGVPVRLVHIPEGHYDYLTMSGREHIVRLTESGLETQILSHVQELQCVSKDSRVINSVLEGEVHVAAGSVVQHCHIQGLIQVNSGCLFSGLDQTVSDQLRHLPRTSDIIVQGHRVTVGELKITVFTVFGAYDNLEAQSGDDDASFLNQPWSHFFSSTGIQREDLWGAVSGAQQTLLDARLFFMPNDGTIGLDGVRFLMGGSGSVESWRTAWRLSLREVLSLTDQQRELQWREELQFSAGRRRVADTLKSCAVHNLLPCMRAAVLGGKHMELLNTLDSVASGSPADLGVAARTLACIADVLGCMAGEGKGGLRSGPAANPSWASAFSLLEQDKLEAGVFELANQRAHWLNRPDLLVRAARHYEGAGQILLRKAVMSARQFVLLGQGDMPPMGEWQEVECPARLDLSGGWSDTPPIAFEHGGVVVNVSVKVDGKRPIGARVCRIPEPRLVLVSRSGPPGCSLTTQTVCDELSDLEDHCQPHAPGALLKAVCVCSDVVCLTSPLSLMQQLLQRWGGGLELHSWSELPHGSGLGTSSILAGAVLAAVYRCTGRSYDTISLIHAVLHLEQILTTGGGWQDQVGGLVGGVKVARSHPSLPLRVDVEQLVLPQAFLTTLHQHLLLIYTGKTRLARNLLQDVVRNWYSRLPSIVQNAEQLVSSAEECAQACKEGSLSKLGECMNRYWKQKKAMAPGCEPAAVRAMMKALQPISLGQSLAGAGGGGFLLILTQHAQQAENVKQILKSTPGLYDCSVHSVQIDMEGITVIQQSTGET